MRQINWLESLEVAKTEAETYGKLVLVLLHDTQCQGSAKTISVTLADDVTQDIIEDNFAPVIYDVNRYPELAAKFNIEWTPTFVITDSNGNELARWVGYLPPVDFACQMMLAIGMADVHMNLLHEAEAALSWVLDKHPDEPLAPKARYYMGLALFKETGEFEHLRRTWEAMRKRYPESIWTRKASAWAM